jgi:MEKHLA domain
LLENRILAVKMTDIIQPAWQQEVILQHTQRLLQSYHHWTGQSLFDLNMAPLEVAQLLFEAPFAVVSHGIEADPILNYGNQTALTLWELNWDTFTQTPSRQTAEYVAQEDRQKLLDETEKNGFIDNYSGIRISSTGKRFYIDKLLIWNVLDEERQRCGQAAMFYRWTFV